MRNGVLQDWGLVEFFDAAEAESTQRQLNNYNLKGHKLRVQATVSPVFQKGFGRIRKKKGGGEEGRNK